MDRRCPTCGGALEAGAARARNTFPLTPDTALLKSEPSGPAGGLVFVRPGVPTSTNPISAFLQGLREEPGEQLLSITAYRCVGCGRVELFATDPQ
jgi:hypothetical protein